MCASVRLASLVAALALAVLDAELRGQRPVAGKPFELTVDSVMRGPKLVGYPPTGLRWAGDSSRLYFEWRQAGDIEPSTWVVGRDGQHLRKLSDDERRSAPPVRGAWNASRARVLFVDEGDIVLVDSIGGSRRAITRTTAAEGNPRWARGYTAITFTRDNNLFMVPLEASGDLLVQLTDVQPRRRDPRESDSQKYLKAEELSLIEHMRLEAERKKLQEGREKARALPKFELQERQSVLDAALSQDGRHVYLLVVERGDARRSEVPSFVTESAYVETSAVRPTVGDTQDKRTLAVLNLETGRSQIVETPFTTREVNWSMPVVADEGTLAVANLRSADNEDRWLVVVDPASAKARAIDALHDEAWVRDAPEPFGWMPDHKHLWFLSERDGWMHLYRIDASAESPRATQLTQGKWEVASASVSPDKKMFYLTSNEVHPGERQVYTMPLDGGERTRLTRATGNHSAEPSPDETTLGVIYSYSNQPPEVFLMRNQPGAEPSRVTTSTSDEWRSFKWADPQVVTYRARDGAEVYARLYTPEMLGARRDPLAPAVVFVHGSGYLQNAHKYWSNYSREYMFHNLLASRGYVVLDPDYRASAGYGRDWRTAIYRHMGGKDLDDVVDGARYLVEKHRISLRRIGVYGGSYGGFITLMALFTSPDTFAAGAALRPVTDWAHYNHNYTSNILDEPPLTAEAYRRSSPIYFAEGLKSPLLIGHGMVDTNVFFQDTVRLVQRLIELRKENWELAVFPVENHGFERETSWADEYKRVLKLFELHLTARD